MKLSKYILPILVFLLLFFYAPFMILFYQSFLGYTGEITLANYIVLFKDSAYRKVILYSLVISLETILFTLLLSYPATLAARREEKNLVSMLVYPPVIIPEITETVTLLLMFVYLGFPLGLISVLIGHTAFNVAYAHI